MDLLVVGGSGYLGREVVRQARGEGHRVAATFHSRGPAVAGVDRSGVGWSGVGWSGVGWSGVGWNRVDIRHLDDVMAVVLATRPDVIINAAYQKADWATTAEGAMHVALAAAATGAGLVHVSSDVVFSGAADRYDETDAPDPTTPYGAAKAAAETAVKGIAPAAVIARTSLIVGDGDSGHERHVHAVAAGEAAGVLFTDVVRCPVHVADLASALLELAGSSYSGMHHVAGSDAVSRHELGVLVARRDGLDPAALPSAPRGPNVPGPLELRLDCTITQARLSTRLRGAREFLAVER